MEDQCNKRDSGNAYGMRLTLLAPKGRGPRLNNILSTLTNWVDPSKQIIDVDELLLNTDTSKFSKRPKTQNGCLVTPALSVMLFVRETGKMCIQDVEQILLRPPWEFHHKVELQNKSAPNKTLAKQEFFKLADDLPLFAACPVLSGNEHLRINLYVHNFPAMVEFYRTITETEIETSKAGFCIFELYRQTGLDIQLSLKKSSHIYPVPVESAYVSFNVKNIKMIKLGIRGKVDHMGSNVYTTRDPDGNLVVLYETNLNNQDFCCNLAGACRRSSCQHSVLPTFSFEASGNFDDVKSFKSLNFDDVKSFKSVSESHDSGRYSDMEGTYGDSYIFAQMKLSKGHSVKSETHKRQGKSEGYASSTTSSEENRNDINSGKDNSKMINTAINTKRSNFATAKVSNDSNTTPAGNVTPVYI